MTSLVLQNASRALEPIILVMSFFLLLRGHDAPGGGFVGGLLFAAAFGLHSIAFGLEATRRAVRITPRALIATGACTALLAAATPLAVGKPLLAGLGAEVSLLGEEPVYLGTPLLFDVGVYLIVAGAVIRILFCLEEG